MSSNTATLSTQLDDVGYTIAKRGLDVTVVLVMALLLSPILIAVALCIWFTDRGPVVFAQIRVGKDGREFKFYKFRSMVTDAEARKAELMKQNQHSDDRTFKMRKDPRVTWIGRFIRRMSIDELPQLWNVFKGDMTLVGPRPAVPAEVARYSASDRRRLAVTPGLTCIWQVSGRAELPFPKQVELDVEYIQKRSIAFDLVLLAKTIPAVLSARGAY
jgi:lipopolysaccharide/colanic/teichoic acid biosynthesis glycosyltransferase